MIAAQNLLEILSRFCLLTHFRADGLKIFDFHFLSSDDPRYKNASGDAVQHLCNNSD